MVRFRSASREPASWLQKYAHFQNDDWKHRCQKTALLNMCLIFLALTAEKQACKKAKTRKWMKSENYRNEETHVASVWMHVSWLYVENHAVARVLRPSLPLSRLPAVFHERPRRGRGPECVAKCCWFLGFCHEPRDRFLAIKHGWIYNFGKDSRNNEN